MDNKDFIDELGAVALGSRFKRLSDILMGDAKKVYRYGRLEMEPRWFTLMSLLSTKRAVSVVEAAKYLGLSQPRITQFGNELTKKGWVKVAADRHDARRKLMSLTTKGKNRYRKMLPVRQSVEKAALALCNEVDADFLKAIKQFEQALIKKSLYDRTMEFIND